MCHSLFGGICPVAILNILNNDIPIAATLATMETLQGVGVVNIHAHIKSILCPVKWAIITCIFSCPVWCVEIKGHRSKNRGEIISNGKKIYGKKPT